MKARNSAQESFFSSWDLKQNAPLTHGGSGSVGKRKEARPLDKSKPLHLILKSSKAKGDLNFLKTNNRAKISSIIKRQATRWGIKIHSFANVGNHLHFNLRFKSREGFRNFLRTLGALIARALTGAKRGKIFGKFWDVLCFTRVVVGRRAELILEKYIRANQIEAREGRQAREEFLRETKGNQEFLRGTGGQRKKRPTPS